MRPAGQLALRCRHSRGDACTRSGGQANGSLRRGKDRSRSSSPPRTWAVRIVNSAALLEPEPAPWLHQEVSHLPEKYRTPVVLCYFEGLTHDEAASRMGCPWAPSRGGSPGLASCCRRRLTRRGWHFPAPRSPRSSQRPTPRRLSPPHWRWPRHALPSRSRAAPTASLAWGSSISIPVTALAEGVLHTMIWNQVRIAAGSLLLAGTLATGVVIGATQLGGGSGSGGTAQVDRQRAKGANARAGTASTTTAKSAALASPNDKSQSATINQLFDRMLSEPIEDSVDTVERLSRWSSLMLSAELVVAANEGEEHAVRAAHRDRMKSSTTRSRRCR